MLKVTKHLIPLFEGNKKLGILHVAIVTEPGYSKLIEMIDKGDAFQNSLDNWPSWDEFAGLAYDRKHIKGHKDWWLILPLENAKTKINVNTVAHEAMHITRMVYDSRGVHFDPYNDEPWAYMVGWITEKAWKSIPRTKRDLK